MKNRFKLLIGYPQLALAEVQCRKQSLIKGYEMTLIEIYKLISRVSAPSSMVKAVKRYKNTAFDLRRFDEGHLFEERQLICMVYKQPVEHSFASASGTV